MKKNFVLVILLITLLLIAGAFLVWQKSEKTPEPSVVQPTLPIVQPVTPSPTSTPPASQVPADWKTYRSEQMKFEIKYPPDWKVDEQEGDVVIYKGEKLVLPSGSPIDPYGRSLNLTILEGGKNCCHMFSAHELKEITINGYYAIQTVYRRSGFWVFSHDRSHILKVGYYIPDLDNPKDRKSEGIFTVILSTFKFLD